MNRVLQLFAQVLHGLRAELAGDALQGVGQALGPRMIAGIQKGLQQGGLPHTFIEQRADSDPAKAKAAFAALRAARCELVFAMGTQAAVWVDMKQKSAAVIDSLNSSEPSS